MSKQLSQDEYLQRIILPTEPSTVIEGTSSVDNSIKGRLDSLAKAHPDTHSFVTLIKAHLQSNSMDDSSLAGDTIPHTPES